MGPVSRRSGSNKKRGTYGDVLPEVSLRWIRRPETPTTGSGRNETSERTSPLPRSHRGDGNEVRVLEALPSE